MSYEKDVKELCGKNEERIKQLQSENRDLKILVETTLDTKNKEIDDIKQLEAENKELRKELAFSKSSRDNSVIALQLENEELKKRLENTEERCGTCGFVFKHYLPKS